jgi:magnesium-transporting ATPase (P-type)
LYKATRSHGFLFVLHHMAGGQSLPVHIRMLNGLMARFFRSAPTSSEKRRIVFLNRPDHNAHFPNNAVTNTKFTAATFLPRMLHQQFSTPMALYFLLIATLQLWRSIAPVHPLTSWAPLVVVFLVSCVKEALDDLARHRADALANGRPYGVWSRGAFSESCPAAGIHVGDLVRVGDGEEVPCDLLLLRGSDRCTGGTLYLETANLDGETDLKSRMALPELQALAPETLAGLQGRFECEPPNADLYRFEATLQLLGGGLSGEFSVGKDQFLQAGTILRRSGWALGMAVYTGRDTKLALNKAPPSPKVSRVDRDVNSGVVLTFCLQALLVFSLGALGSAQRSFESPAFWYLGWTVGGEDGGSSSSLAQQCILPLRFLLLSSMMIPISLKVSMDIIKSWYAVLIAQDVGLRGASAANSALCEDLGAVTHVLTDKTGTLTENVMVLRAICVAGALFGRMPRAEGSSSRGGGGGEGSSERSGRRGTPTGAFFRQQQERRGDGLGDGEEGRDGSGDEGYGDDKGNDGNRESEGALGIEEEDVDPVTSLLRSKTPLSTICGSPPNAGRGGGPLAGLQNDFSATEASSFSSSSEHHSSSRRASGVSSHHSGSSTRSSSISESSSTLPSSPLEADATLVSLLKNLASAPAPTAGRAAAVAGSAGGGPPSIATAQPPSSANANATNVANLLLALALCNTVTPEHRDAAVEEPSATSSGASRDALTGGFLRSRLILYGSASPDEDALVHGASRLGCALTHRAVLAGGMQRLSVSFAAPGESTRIEEAMAAAGRGMQGAARRGSYTSSPFAAGGRERGSSTATSASAATGGGGAAVAAEKLTWVSDRQSSAEYEVLAVIEFTSDRKRMSVVVQCVSPPTGGGMAGRGLHGIATPDTGLWLITKGADDVILPRLAPGQEEGDFLEGGEGASQGLLNRGGEEPRQPRRCTIRGAVDRFANVGLRTLLVGVRRIAPIEWTAWKHRWEVALSEVGSGRLAAVAEVAEGLEHGLQLVGATAIEDKLQAGVPAAISALREANVAVWMLTGDKASTALQIACSAKMVDSTGGGGGSIIHLSASSLGEVRAQLEEAREIILFGVSERAQRASPNASISISAVSANGGGLGGRSTPPPAGGVAPALHHSSSCSTLGPLTILAQEGTPTFSISSVSSIIVEGAALRLILGDAASLTLFTRLAQRCKMLIACRCTPHQKAALVSAFQTFGNSEGSVGGDGEDWGRSGSGGASPNGGLSSSSAVHLGKGGEGGPGLSERGQRGLCGLGWARDAWRWLCSSGGCSNGGAGGKQRTLVLSIGDGGNDVAMIQAADVGVGVSGREGQQASRAADFTLPSFALLPRLMFTHGRLSHYRSALTAQYTVYKSMVICFLQLLYNASCAFSGCSLLDAISLTSYNLLLTAVPSTLMALDSDASVGALMAAPARYLESAQLAWFTPRSLGGWAARGLIQAGIILGVCGAGGVGAGAADGQLVLSNGAYTAVVLLQALTIYSELKRPTGWNAAASAMCALLHVLLLAGRSYVFPGPARGLLEVMAGSATPWSSIALAVLACWLPWVAANAYSSSGAAVLEGASALEKKTQGEGVGGGHQALGSIVVEGGEKEGLLHSLPVDIDTSSSLPYPAGPPFAPAGGGGSNYAPPPPPNSAATTRPVHTKSRLPLLGRRKSIGLGGVVLLGRRGSVNTPSLKGLPTMRRKGGGGVGGGGEE